MPSPQSSLATLRPDLEASLEQFDLEANEQGMVANEVLRVAEVARQAGNFGKIPPEELLLTSDTVRSPGSGYQRGQFQFDDDTYSCQEHGWEEPVDDREADMYADYFNAELVATARARSKILVNHEIRAANLLQDTGTFSNDAVSNAWSNATNATPVDDVEGAVNAIYDASGLWPNALVINRKLFRLLRNTDQVIDRIESAGAGFPARAADITIEQLAQVFDLDYIFVAGGSKNNANKGQTFDPVQIWSTDRAVICRVATTDDFRTPCVGRTFHWSSDGSSPRGIVESYRDETVRSDIIRVRHDVDQKILMTSLGYVLTNTNGGTP